MPAGIIACFRPLTDASLFLVLYGLAAVYFSGVMVRHDKAKITLPSVRLRKTWLREPHAVREDPEPMALSLGGTASVTGQDHHSSIFLIQIA